MKLCLLAVVMLVWVVWVTWLPARARAQSGTDISSTIVLVHPDVPTILRLPDEIEDVWSIGPRVIMVKGVGSTLHLRPQPDTPAGAEMFIEVKTRTLHRIFLLRVVERAEDAAQEIVVPAPAAAECADAAPGASSMRPAPATLPANTSTCAPSPTAEPGPAPAETEPVTPAPATEAATEHTGATRASRFAVSLHAVAALAGTTALDVAGYEAKQARQPHRAVGVRLAVHPRGGWLAGVANVGGEWPVAPTVHRRGPNAEPGAPELLTVSGPRLHADVGLKAQLGTRWSPTVYAGIGLHVHHRNTEAPTELEGSKGDMPFGGVLALGLGLEYRARNLLMGLELHVRQGIPADYRSMAALLSVGWILDQGE